MTVYYEIDVDEFERFPFTQSVNLPSYDYFSRWEKRCLVRTKRNARHISKPKSVK